MSRHYISRYLNTINLGGSVLLFNGVNGCLDEVSGTPAEILRQGDSERLTELDATSIAFLLNRGHITALPPEEELLRFKEFAAAVHSRLERHALHSSLMLLMSYNCNLSCKYCYQQKHRPHKSNATMSVGLLENIFERRVAEIFPGGSLKNFEISFYGGEPFLPANEAVIRKALEYSRKYGIKTNAISNATMVHMMPDIFGPGPGLVNRIQVSLDGSKEIHDASRVSSSGDGTFNKITDNISLLLERKARVSIRLNLDKKALKSIPKLLKELGGKGILGHKYASIYASPLHDNLAEVDDSDFMDLAELSKEVFAFGIDLEHPVSLRANEMSYLFSLEKGIGLTHTCFCMQTMQRTLVVDPFGDLYACFEEAGYPEYRVGHVSDGGVEFFPLRDQYKARHLANMDDCLKCSVALACGGQCGVRCRAKTGDLFRPHCHDIKQVILDGLKLAYQKKQRRLPDRGCEADVAPVPSTHE